MAWEMEECAKEIAYLAQKHAHELDQVFQRLQSRLSEKGSPQPPGEMGCLLTRISTGDRGSSLEAPHSPDDKPPKVAFMGSELPGAVAEGGAKEGLTAVLPMDGLGTADARAEGAESEAGSTSEESSGGDASRDASPRGSASSYARTKKQVTRKKIIKSQDEQGTNTWQQRLVYSPCYELYSALLILLNAIFVGWQTEYAASTVNQPASQDGFEPTFFFVAQIVFFLAFFFDLVLRWIADGLIYFVCNEEMYWNVLDIFVVSFNLVEVITETMMFAGSEHAVLMTNFTVVRMIRVLRVVRIARVIRVLKAFRELRLMVASIVSSARNLLWVIMILCVLLYVFGISFTSAVALELEMSPADAPGTDELKRYFGSLSSSILTLYSSMSGGEDWTVYYYALGRLAWPYQTLFLFFVTFAVFAVVNVVTGVFVDTAIEKNQTDKELAIQEELRSKKLRMNWIRDVFSELDSSGDGTVTLKEFESQLNHEAVIAYFNTLKLDVSDARTLFRLLDSDGSDGVNIEEFVQGCYRLSGEATTLHTQVMQCDIKDIMNKMGHIVGLLDELRVSLASRRRSSRPSGRFSGISELADVADAAPRASHRSSMDSVQMA